MSGASRDRGAMTAKAAAKRLGLTTLEVTRLVASSQLAGYWTPGRTGRSVAMVYTDAVTALAGRVQAMTPDPEQRRPAASLAPHPDRD